MHAVYFVMLQQLAANMLSLGLEFTVCNTALLAYCLYHCSACLEFASTLYLLRGSAVHLVTRVVVCRKKADGWYKRQREG